MARIYAIVAAVLLLQLPQVYGAPKTLLHMGSSIHSVELGYAGTFYNTLSPLSLQRVNYAGLETLKMIQDAFNQTKNQVADLGFTTTRDKMPKDGTKVYAGYDIVNFTLDYHTVRGWSQSAVTDAGKKSTFQSSLGGVFDRMRKEYPAAFITLTSSPPVKDPYWGDLSNPPNFAYNTVVKAMTDWSEEVCKAKHVPHINLYRFCVEKGIKPGSDGRHYTASARSTQGKFVGEQVLAAVKATSTIPIAPHSPALAQHPGLRLQLMAEHCAASPAFSLTGARINRAASSHSANGLRITAR